jgi:hypothetical protein
MNVSFFNNSIRNSQVTAQVPLKRILDGIKEGQWKAHVEAVRQARTEHGKNSAQFKQAKENSPNFTTSGTFDRVRRKDTLLNHSGFIDIDIDGIDASQLDDLKAKIITFPFVAAVYTSISGHGLCAVCCVQPNAELHETFCNTLIAYFIGKGVNGVDYLKDWSRARFISFDPDLIFAENYRQLQPDDLSIVAPEIDKMPVKGNGDRVEYYTADECIDHAWQSVGKKKTWEKGHHFEYAVDFILYCNDMGVPESDVLSHFKSIAPDYEDGPKLVKSYYRNASSKHGSRRPVKNEYKGNGFLFSGQGGHTSFIPKMYDGHVVEDLKQYDPVLDKHRITQGTRIRPFPRLVQYGSGVVARAGDHVVVSAQSKAGKGYLFRKLMAGLLMPYTVNNGQPIEHLFGFTFGINPNNYAIIAADTEQSDDDVQDVLDEVIEDSGRTSEPDFFYMLAIKEIPKKERAAMIVRAVQRAVEKHGGVHALFIDGTADLIPDVNDAEKVSELYDLLSGIAGRYNFPIFHVIHMNPSAYGKERGHLGSEMRRKCATLIRLEYDEENRCSWVVFKLMRKAERGMQFLIRWDIEKGTFVRDDQKMQQIMLEKGKFSYLPRPDDSGKFIDLYRQALNRVFLQKPSASIDEISAAILEDLQKSTWISGSISEREKREHLTRIRTMNLIEPDKENDENFVSGLLLNDDRQDADGAKYVWNKPTP